MSEFIKNNFWPLVIVLAVADVLTLGGFYWSEVKIPDELKLKADTSKILSAREVDWKVYDDFGNIIADKGRGIKYFYISDVKVPPEPGEDMAKRTDNAKFFKNKVSDLGEEYTAKFYGGQPFYKEGGKWYQTESAITTPEAYREQTKVSWLENLFGQTALATVENYYPDTNAGDGYIEGTGSSFNNAHDAAAGVSANAALTAASLYVYRQNSASWWIRRISIPFNTSALPDTATISAATLYASSTANFTNNLADASSTIAVVHTFTAATTTLDTSDYVDIGSNNDTAGTANNINIQQGGSVALSTLTSGGATYRSIALNATGIAWISLTGYTKLGLREGHDVVKAGAGFTSDGWFNGGAFCTSEQTGTGSDPYLAVTYTIPSNYPFAGYIDELRISSGTARWTANFTPTSTEY